ncbi:hypothetical protein ACFWVC_24845 [Streptomyces sp. NPDC058691]|uniref:hypothetical protein n=1 Tax=Streptomyces sp. NPDC058691 TaxID=3346601 RepID=UPI00364D6CC8
MNPELTKIRDLMDAGDTGGAARALRAHADSADPAALAPLVEALARRAGSGDLAAAATALAATPDGVAELYAYGYACVEEGAAYLAVPALRAALRRVPDSRRVLVELVAALEREERHREALDVLRERGSALAAWPERYLLAHNALMAGELALARDTAARLPVPAGDDEQWLPADTRLRRRLRRADAVAGTAALDATDLRGWHHVLTGGVLATLSPYGFESMTGRYAYVQDSPDLCRAGLDRLRLALTATGVAPRAVAALPDRSSRIMGLAAARVLELPVEPYVPGRPDTVVVAYDLTDADPGLLGGLLEPAPGQVLYEHATCWTRPPAVSADVSGLLAQHCVAPWGERLRMSPDGSPGVVPPDDRSEHDIAHEVVAADPMPDRGDGGTPPDPDTGFTAFAARLAGRWPDGPRERTASAGPVAGARFA